VDQPVNLIFLREARHGIRSVLVNTADKIIGDANVKGTADPTGEDINPEGSLPAHHRCPEVLDCPLSRAMTERN
jgi:hypothetical protein